MTALPSRGDRLKVLVVDDDAVARRLIVANLRQRYDIIEAGDGVEAVEQFSAQQPDVVVMDVEMPRATGSEAAAAMRLLAGTRYVPILLVSSLDEISVLVTSLSNGADDFLPKPFNPRLFESKLQVFLRLRDMQQRLVDQNRELSRFREETEREQVLARQVFARLMERSGLDDPNVAVATSALGVLSGDIVTAARLPSGGFRWLLGDMAGHGLSGALGTLPVVTLFNETCARGDSIEAVVRRLNQELKTVLPPSLFCAAAVLELDAPRTTVRIVNAGLPEVLVTTPERVHVIASGCLPLGISAGSAFTPQVVETQVGPGSMVWAMSDGLVEACSPTGEYFGLARVTEAVAGKRTIGEAMGALQDSLCTFTAGEQGDDVAIVGVAA
jgi:CheY-like chemotaxis protein